MSAARGYIFFPKLGLMPRVFAPGASPVSAAASAIAPSVTSTIASAVPTVFPAITTVAALIALFVAGRKGFFGFDTHFCIAVRHRGFARETNAAFFIHAEAFDPDFVAHFDDVFGLLHAEVGQFADVNQAVLAGQEFDE